MDIRSWNKETKQAYIGTLLYSVLGIFAAILTPFAIVGKAAGTLSAAENASRGGSGLLLTIVEIGIIIGYIVFFLAIKDLKAITEDEDKKAFNKIFVSIIFDVFAALFGILHLGVLAGILAIASCLMLIFAYSSLRSSNNIDGFSPAAVSGFNLLFTAEVLVIIAICLSWIPVIKIIGAILKAIAWIFVLYGWKKVATPVEIPGEAPTAEKPILDSVKEVLTESYSEAKEVAKEAAKASKIVAEEISSKAKEAGANIKEKLDDVHLHPQDDNASSSDDASPKE